jgi:hypothetical protein
VNEGKCSNGRYIRSNRGHFGNYRGRVNIIDI